MTRHHRRRTKRRRSTPQPPPTRTPPTMPRKPSRSSSARTRRATRHIPSMGRPSRRSRRPASFTTRRTPIGCRPITTSAAQKSSLTCWRAATRLARQAFIKAHQDADFQKGVDSLGRLEGAAQVGNWDGVNTHLNAILSNAGYINPANHEASAEPIIDPATGKATGLDRPLQEQEHRRASHQELQHDGRSS